MEVLISLNANFVRFLKLIKVLCFYLTSKIYSKKKNILILAQFTPLTGTHTYFTQIISFFCKKEFNVAVCVNHSNLSDVQILQHKYVFKIIPYDQELSHYEYFGSKKFVFNGLIFDNYYTRVIFLLKILISTRSSVLWVSSQHPTQFFPTLLMPVKVFYVVHAMLWANPDGASNFFLRLFKNKKSLKFITVSSAAKRKIKAFWDIDKNKISVLPNYFEPKYTSHPVHDNSIPIILSIGTLDDNKQPFLFAKLAQKAFEFYGDKLRFLWIGTGPLFTECKKLEMHIKNLSFLGSKESLDEYYSKATIYLQLSKTESQGIAILGAMYNAIPCIVTNEGGPKEMVLHDFNGFNVDVKNENIVFSKIKFLLENPKIAREMGQRGCDIYKSKFTKQNWEFQMETVINC